MRRTGKQTRLATTLPATPMTTPTTTQQPATTARRPSTNMRMQRCPRLGWWTPHGRRDDTSACPRLSCSIHSTICSVFATKFCTNQIECVEFTERYAAPQLWNSRHWATSDNADGVFQDMKNLRAALEEYISCEHLAASLRGITVPAWRLQLRDRTLVE